MRLPPWLFRIAIALFLPLIPASVAEGQVSRLPVAVDSIFAHYNTSSPGCVVGINSGGSPVLRSAYGMADLERMVPLATSSRLEAGSVSKQVTTAAVTLLALDGKINFEDPVHRYFPELPEYERPITIRMLIDHTSGLREWVDVASMAGWPRGSRNYTNPDIVDEIISRQKSLNYPPGDAYSYTNSGYILLTELVERVSGEKFADFTHRRIFSPLGMKNTGWRDDWRELIPGRALAYAAGIHEGEVWRHNNPVEDSHGAGGMVTTVEDLLIWNESLTNRTLSSAMVDSLHRRGFLTSGEQITYAGGIVVSTYRGTRELSHSGSTAGYRAFLARYPDQGNLSVAILCNSATANPTQFTRRIADIASSGLSVVTPAAAPAATGPAFRLDTLMKYVGTYRSEELGATLRILIENDSLVVRRRRAERWVITQSSAELPSVGPWRFWFTNAQGGNPVLHLRSLRAHDVHFIRVSQ